MIVWTRGRNTVARLKVANAGPRPHGNAAGFERRHRPHEPDVVAVRMNQPPQPTNPTSSSLAGTSRRSPRTRRLRRPQVPAAAARLGLEKTTRCRWFVLSNFDRSRRFRCLGERQGYNGHNTNVFHFFKKKKIRSGGGSGRWDEKYTYPCHF